MITTIALLLAAQDAGFNPHLATCWNDPGCASEHMGGRDANGNQDVSGHRDMPEESGVLSGTLAAEGWRSAPDDSANPLCTGDLTTDRRCIGTPRAELGEGIVSSGTSYPAEDATGIEYDSDLRGAAALDPGNLHHVDCGPGDKRWPHCVRTDPSIYFPPMRNGYLGHLTPAFREQLRSELLRPDEPPVQIIDDHTFLVRRDQLAYFHVLWRLCPSCVEVRDDEGRNLEVVRYTHSISQGSTVSSNTYPVGPIEASRRLILTYHRPHNWRQYADKRHITELMPAVGSGNTPEARETIAGLVLSPHDLRYEYVGRSASRRTAEALRHVLEPDEPRSMGPGNGLAQQLYHQRINCTQYCGDRTPAEMQYDLNTRTATSGTRPGVVEPVVASSLPAAQLLILEVAREHWQEIIDANRAADRWLGIPSIEPSRDDWPDMGLFQHLIPADRREDW